MYKNAGKHRHSFDKPTARSPSARLAEVAHSQQTWEQPKRHHGNEGHYTDTNIDPTEPSRKKWRTSGCSVYALKFVHLKTGLTFLKIGITKNSINFRFEADLDRYAITTVSLVGGVNRQDASMLEKTFHTLFKKYKFIPPIPLRSGGNSECFTYTAELEASVKDLVKRWTKPIKPKLPPEDFAPNPGRWVRTPWGKRKVPKS